MKPKRERKKRQKQKEASHEKNSIDERLRPKNSEVNHLLGSNKKIQQLTDWKPQYTLEYGIKDTIEWIKANMDSYKTDIYNI